MGKVYINNRIFPGKRSLPWRDVEEYLKRYVGNIYTISESGDDIIIPKDFPDEYTGSEYTKKLRGGVAVAKANAVVSLAELIENATNRRFVENMERKHSDDASNGWFRYDICFSMIVRGENEVNYRENVYRGTLVVRRNKHGNELYDIVNIKKEASKPLES